jgi:NhaP-type Na+/H+ or K+/H+ antiporter
MQLYIILAILAAFAFVYAAIADRLARTLVSGALVFTGFGVLCGPLWLNILPLRLDAEALRTLAELTLALVLFTDASKADLRVLRLNIGLPERLLLIGLPLSIVMGFGAGALVFDGLTVLELGILATMLAPTDAALGKPVVSNPAVPAKVRESLNVESGLNDGICVPVLFIFLTLATQAGGTDGTAGFAIRLILKEVGIGAVVGVVLTPLAAGILWLCFKRGWVAEAWLPIPIVALTITCFATAQALGGSGFIAAFVGGLVFGGLVKHHKEPLLTAAEGTGGVFSLFTWVVFGVAVVSISVEHFDWRILLYAVLSLTIVRVLPVVVSLLGTGLRMESKLFIGWFGPRGLASVVFIIIVLGEDLPGQNTLAVTVVCTVVLSIIAHGLTAMPLAAVYGARAQRRGV